MRYLIGIDNGGTFSKAAVFTEDGRQISAASVPSVTYAPKPGYTERDMDELWTVNAQAVREAIEKSGIDPKLIAGVSFSGHGKGLYLVGKYAKRMCVEAVLARELPFEEGFGIELTFSL